MSRSAPPSRPPPSAGALSSFGGAALLVGIAARYRLDRTLCAAWPSKATGVAYGALYLIAIALLIWGWRSRSRLALPAHAIAIFAAPFLSSDPLMYAAIGRALAHGASASTPLSVALGNADPFLIPLPPAWQNGTSAYGPLWNALAKLLGTIAGDDLGLALRLHQGCAMLALLAGAWIASRAFTKADLPLVALCPLAFIEATIGAHNDALLIPFVALALLWWLRGRSIAVLLVLAAGALVKASAVIFVFPAALAMILSRLDEKRRKPATIAVAILGVAGLAILPALRDGPLDAVSRLVERPDVAFDHCTRSLECLPRVLFRFVLHMPTAAWATGLVFRAVSVVWLCWISFTAAQESDRRAAARWIALGLFLYFLVLHGWAQSWYVLPLLPTLPLFEGDRFGPGVRLYTITAVLYYAFVLPMSCLGDQVVIAVSDLVEASITFFPPVVLLVRAWRR